MVYVGVVFVPILMYHFGLVFMGINKQASKVKILKFGYLLSIIFLFLSRTDYFVAGVYRYQWGVHTSAQILHHIFLVYFAIYIVMFLWQIINYYYHLEKSIKKLQAGYVVLAFLLIVIVGSTAYLPAYHIAIYPFAYLSGVIFSGFVGWAIIRYRFMGIKFVVRKSTIIFISAAIILLVYNLINLFSQQISEYLLIEPKLLLLFSVLGLAIAFQPLKNYIQASLDRLVFPGAEKYEQTWQRINQGAFDKVELSEIINNLTIELNHLYDFKGIDIILKQNIGDDYQLVYSTIAKAECRVQSLQKIATHFNDCKNILVTDELSFLLSENVGDERWQLLEILKKHNYDIAIPLFIDKEIVGTIFANHPRKVLKIEDFNLLQQIANRASLAIGQLILYQQAMARINRSTGLVGVGNKDI